jgi:hypothetical protein
VVTLALKNIGQVLAWNSGLIVSLLSYWPSCPLQTILLSDLVGCGSPLQIIMYSDGPVFSHSYGQLIKWSAGHVVSQSCGQLIKWSAGHVVRQSCGQLIKWSSGMWSASHVVSQSCGQLIKWSAGHVVSVPPSDQLVTCPTCHVIPWLLFLLATYVSAQHKFTSNYGGDIHIYYLSTHNKKINKINI